MGAALACGLMFFCFVWGLASADRRSPQPILIDVEIALASVKPDRPGTRIAPPDLPPMIRVRPVRIAPPLISQPVIAAPQEIFPPSVEPKKAAAPVTPQRPQAAPALPPDYLSLLLAHLNAYKRYPFAARRRHEQGIVRLHFMMDRAGNVLSYQVVGSSGFPDLDDAARAMIQDAQPLPPVPAKYPGTTLDLILPLVFSLH